jgi:hypothetical protein
MSVGCSSICFMTKTFLFITLLIASTFGFITFAGSASAAVNETSRVVVVDLPASIEKNDSVYVYVNQIDGGIYAFVTTPVNGEAVVLVEEPALMKSITVKVGNKRVAPVSYVVTDLTPDVSAHGMELELDMVNKNGVTQRVLINGTVVVSGSTETIAPRKAF